MLAIVWLVLGCFGLLDFGFGRATAHGTASDAAHSDAAARWQKTFWTALLINLGSGPLPIFTPVGEITHYCRCNENALLVQNDGARVGDIMTVLHDDAWYQMLRKDAVSIWAEKHLL